MRVSVDSAIFDHYPDLIIGVALLQGVKNDAANMAIAQLLTNKTIRIVNLLLEKQVNAEPYVALWRSSYKQFGAIASKYLSSFESLRKKAVKNRELPSLNPSTDLYNHISIKFRISAGNDGADKV